jgi:5-methylcytosine-specific restriction protein A
MGRFYDKRAWRDRIRKDQLARHPLCERCLAMGRVVAAEHVDHRIPISKGGSERDPENLASLCAPCHSQKTAEDEGKTVRYGTDAQGNPVDPKHHWHG